MNRTAAYQPIRSMLLGLACSLLASGTLHAGSPGDAGGGCVSRAGGSPCAAWTADVSYVQMWRETTGDDYPLVVGSGGSPPLYDTADLGRDIDSAPGLDARLSRRTVCGQGIDFRLLWLSSFEGAGPIDPAATFFAPATNTTSTIVHATAGAAAYYESDFVSFEVLGTRRADCHELSYGFRYAGLNEHFSPTAANASGDAFHADNHLFGLQLGLESDLWTSRQPLSIRSIAKAGVYYNDVDLYAQTHAPGLILSSATRDTGSAAFLGEFGLQAEYELSYSCSLQLGYRLILLDGVSLASDLVPNVGGFAPSVTPPIGSDKSTLLMHGLQVGAERRF